MTIVNNHREQNRNVCITFMGDNWLEFLDKIPYGHSDLYESCISIILNSFPDSLLPTQIIHLLIDEQVEDEKKPQVLLHMLYDQIIDIVNRMGVWLDKDYVEIKHLQQLSDIADVFFYITEVTDAFNTILPFLAAHDMPPKYRFIHSLAKMIHPEQEEPDITEYECIIEDVSEDTIRILEDSITMEDHIDIPPDAVIKRVQLNKELLNGTIAYSHVRNGGSLCGSVESYMGFFKTELEEIIKEDTIESALKYGTEVIGIFLISNYNDTQIKDKLLTYFSGRVDNLVAQFQLDEIVKKLKLDVPNSGDNQNVE